MAQVVTRFSKQLAMCISNRRRLDIVVPLDHGGQRLADQGQISILGGR